MCVVGCLYHNLFVPQGTTIASQLFFQKSHTKISVIIPFIFQKPEQNVSAASLQCPMYSASLFYLFMGHPERKFKVCHAITGFCQRSPTSAYVYSFSFFSGPLKIEANADSTCRSHYTKFDFSVNDALFTH
jgi:hypothetical protein